VPNSAVVDSRQNLVVQECWGSSIHAKIYECIPITVCNFVPFSEVASKLRSVHSPSVDGAPLKVQVKARIAECISTHTIAVFCKVGGTPY